MKVESLSRADGKRERFTVLFEDGTQLKVTASQIADFGLYSGLEMTQDEFGGLVTSLKQSSSKASAIRMLGSRNLSAREIEKRLVSRGDTAENAASTVEWLEKIGAVNDAQYAEMIVKHYCAKGYGAARIRDELFRRGIPRDLWEDALGGAEGMEDAARGYLEKKLRGSRDKDDLRRATDALCRRGYSYEEARAAVGRYVEGYE